MMVNGKEIDLQVSAEDFITTLKNKEPIAYFMMGNTPRAKAGSRLLFGDELQAVRDYVKSSAEFGKDWTVIYAEIDEQGAIYSRAAKVRAMKYTPDKQVVEQGKVGDASTHDRSQAQKP